MVLIKMLECFLTVLQYSSHLCVIHIEGYADSTLSRALQCRLEMLTWKLNLSIASDGNTAKTRCQDIYSVLALWPALYTTSFSLWPKFSSQVLKYTMVMNLLAVICLMHFNYCSVSDAGKGSMIHHCSCSDVIKYIQC